MNEYNRGWCTKVINDLIRMPISYPFRQPVDPQLDHAPDYYQKIKKPMDLSKVKSNLNSGTYTTPEQFVADLKLILENARTFNGPDCIYENIADVIEKWINKQYEAKLDSYDSEWTHNLNTIVAKLRKHIENAPKEMRANIDPKKIIEEKLKSLNVEDKK